MSNSKHVERRLARLKAKYAAQGGSPRQLRRKAEVKAKREQKEPIIAAPDVSLHAAVTFEQMESAKQAVANLIDNVSTVDGIENVATIIMPPL